jgi:hypothetical protein
MHGVRDQIDALTKVLVDDGWKVVNGPGDMTSPNGIVWFSVGYAHGEYTVSAWGRRRGAGPSLGTIRIRLTPSVVSSHPGVGTILGAALVSEGFLQSIGDDPSEFPGNASWPPATWAELAYQSVTSSAPEGDLG